MVNQYHKVFEFTTYCGMVAEDAAECLKVLPSKLPSKCRFDDRFFNLYRGGKSESKVYESALRKLKEHAQSHNTQIQLSLGELLMVSAAAKVAGVEEELPDGFTPGYWANFDLMKAATRALYVSFEAINADAREFALGYLSEHLQQLEKLHRELSEKENKR